MVEDHNNEKQESSLQGFRDISWKGLSPGYKIRERKELKWLGSKNDLVEVTGFFFLPKYFLSTKFVTPGSYMLLTVKSFYCSNKRNEVLLANVFQ